MALTKYPGPCPGEGDGAPSPLSITRPPRPEEYLCLENLLPSLTLYLAKSDLFQNFYEFMMLANLGEKLIIRFSS